MEQIDLTLFEHGATALANLRSLLVQFEQYTHNKVRLNILSWANGWNKLVDIALSHSGADISEIGTTWLSDFTKMGALYAFTNRDISMLGGSEQFIEASWQSCMVASSRGVLNPWSVPWSADTRCIYYHRDWLEKAGIEETDAFDTFQHFEDTLARLKESGVRIPLALPTSTVRINVHNLAMWVWGSGGDFLDSSGKELIIDQPAAQRGMQSYFEMGRFLTSDTRRLSDTQADDFFAAGLAGVAISGVWMLQDARVVPRLSVKIGTAPIPGTPFVGGTNLVVWKHAKNREVALQLVRFLTSRQAGELIHPFAGLPVRNDILDTGLYVSDPHLHVLADALRSGRSFPTGHLWGILEKRLGDGTTAIWDEIFSNSQPDIGKILQSHIQMISQRLRTALG
jgi:multiple sugar transport system substrate-binding protein